MNIAIIGTGNVGLITGACLSDVGNKVFCFDIDSEKIENLKNGNVQIYESGLNRLVNKNLNVNLFFSHNLESVVSDSDIIFLTVGTPMNQSGGTNMDCIYNAAMQIGSCINNKKLIITKSTIPVGETYNIRKIISKEINKRKVDIKFDVANNPEFLKEGKGINDFMSPDRIVVGIDDGELKSLFINLYRPFSVNHEKLIFMDIKSSELTKYAANAMLATRISFINELSILAEKTGADINSIRRGIGSDRRIGYNYIYPSVGYGGSCFEKDLNSMIYVSKKFNCNLGIIKSVEDANLNQRDYFINKIIRKFDNGDSIRGKTFTIWGLSFKPGTSDVRGSVSIYIINKIIEMEGKLHLYDPKASDNIKNIFKKQDRINYFNDKYEATKSSDALILLTEWPEFRSPDFSILKRNLNKPLIFDGRNQYDKYMINSLGFEYHQIGVPLL